jgi:hypothetical protein
VNVFLIGFIPVLIAAGWVLLATQPDPNWFRDHIRSWTDDIGINGLVGDLGQYLSVLAFGVGLVFGFTFDTTGPAAYGPFGRQRRAAPAEPVPVDKNGPPPEDTATAREEREAAARGAGRAAAAGLRAASRQDRREARARARLSRCRESAPVGAPRLTAWLVRAERHHEQVHEEARHGAEDERRAAADAHREAAEPDVKAEHKAPHEGPEPVREGG